jgi:hypothetical protein
MRRRRRRRRNCVVMCSFSIMIKVVLQVLKPVAESERIVVHVLEDAQCLMQIDSE